jgi:hypothetical protein
VHTKDKNIKFIVLNLQIKYFVLYEAQPGECLVHFFVFVRHKIGSTSGNNVINSMVFPCNMKCCTVAICAVQSLNHASACCGVL